MATTRTNVNYHVCECYGHDNTIPDYQHEVSIPRTLQGYYAKSGGCPCHAKATSTAVNNVNCVCGANGAAATANAGSKSYRAADGPHTVQVAAPSGDFPNSKNYGGTVSQRGATTMENTAKPRGAATKRRLLEKKEEQLQDRKNFLKAVLRDEMLARLDAETRRDALEQGTGLMGSNHVVDYEATTAVEAGVDNGNSLGATALRGSGSLPTVAQQHDDVMDELRYVASQPVGSKYNINRLYYLLEEEQRINALRFQEKMATRSRKA